MIKDIIYSFNRSDYFYYVFTTLIIFIIVNKSGLVTIHNILAVLVTMGISYGLIHKKVLNDLSDMHRQNKKLKQVQISKYPYLKNDIHIIECIHKLQGLSYINRLKFNSILENINRFFKYYEMSMNLNLRPTDLYVSAKDNSNRALNALKSFVIDINKYPYLDSDRNISENDFISDNNNIYNCRELIKSRLSIYLTEMEQKINSDWDSGDVNIYSKPVYVDDPDGIARSDILHSDLYDLY